MKTTERFVDLDGQVRVGLLESDAGDFLGIGSVSVGGVALRDGARPIQIRFDTPTGILYTRLAIERIEPTPSGEVRVGMKAFGFPWGRTEHADEYDQPMVDLAAPTEPVEDRLVLLLTPAKLSLAGREWRGFSHAFQFVSASRKIHRLWTHATWEIGGSVEGNTVLHQGQCNMPVYEGRRDTLLTTACLKTLEQHGSPQGVSYQLGPRGGLLQTFDFQYATQGALLMHWPKFESVSSVIESPVGDTHLHVVDEYRFPLAKEVTTTPKEILFAPGTLQEHEARNLWWEAHERVNGSIRAAHGVKPTHPMPDALLYKDVHVYVKHRRLRLRIMESDVDSTEAFYTLADRVLPVFAKQGVRRFWIPLQVTHNDATELGMRRKFDIGLHGDFICSGPCATHRFYPSDFWGGMKAWKYFADKAHSLKMQVGHWFAPHLSPRAPVLQKHPEYLMTNLNSLHRGGGYGDMVAPVDWNTGIREWILEDLKRWRDEGGLDFLFLDSWSNMGLLPRNYAEGMRTNLHALGRFFADVQKIGIAALAFEGISPFGQPWFSVADLQGGRLNPEQGVVGQNDFGWWVEQEDMACGMTFVVGERGRVTQELERIQFRMMANRAYANFCSGERYNLKEGLPDWWERLNHAYLHVAPHMKTRRLIPGRKGTCWEDGDVRVIWSFDDGSVRLSDDTLVDLIEGTKRTAIQHNGTLFLKPWSLYRIEGVSSGTRLFA